MASSVENLALGRGILYHAPHDTNGVLAGERDLGACPNMNLAVESSYFDHFSSRSGIKNKDKRILIQSSSKMSFTLEEMSKENLAMFFGATVTSAIVAASSNLSDTITANLDRFHPLSGRKVGVHVLQYNSGSVVHAIGDIVSNGTGSGTVLQVIGNATSGTLLLGNITPGFQAGLLTSDGSGVSSAIGAESFDTTMLAVTSVATPNGFVKNTDYTVDSKTGRIYIVSGGNIDEGELLTVKGGTASVTQDVLSALKNATVTGSMRFVSDNPEGPNWEVYARSVQISASGDLALITDEDIQSMSFEAEVLRNADGTFMELSQIS